MIQACSRPRLQKLPWAIPYVPVPVELKKKKNNHSVLGNHVLNMTVHRMTDTWVLLFRGGPPGTHAIGCDISEH